jgi:prepilin-type N-terminal cleavage/methylation domain-containing protein
MRSAPSSHRRQGFTLLEVVMAIGLMAVIVGMVVGISRTSLVLGKRIVETQNEAQQQHAFLDLLGQTFSAMPGNTRFDLKVQDSGSHYLSDLTLQNVPMSFTWGGEDRIAKAVQLSTVKRRSGYLDIVLRYFENEILEGSESTFESSAKKDEPFAEIVLIEDVAFFEWRLLDGRSMEWQYDWEIQGRLPLQIELTCAIGAKGEEIRQVFWAPPKQNPEVLMRQMAQGGGNGDAGNANGGNGGNVTIPGVNIGGQTGTPQPPTLGGGGQ